MSKFIDYYHILNVDQTATQEQIKKSYHVLAGKYHPDRGGEAAKMTTLNEAYSIISDVNLRQSYDEIYFAYHERGEESAADAANEANQLIEILLQAKASAKKSAITGFVWLVIGAAVTVGGYTVASNGGHYLVAWGAILFGGAQFIKGLHYFFNPHLLLKKNMDEQAYNATFGTQEYKYSPMGIVYSGAALVILLIAGAVIAGISSQSNLSSSSGTGNSPSQDTSANASASAALTTDQQNLHDTVNQAKSTYEQCTAQLHAIDNQLTSINNQMDTYDSAGNTYAFKALVPQQNQLVEQYKSQKSTCDDEFTAANNAVDTYNKSIGQ